MLRVEPLPALLPGLRPVSPPVCRRCYRRRCGCRHCCRCCRRCRRRCCSWCCAGAAELPPVLQAGPPPALLPVLRHVRRRRAAGAAPTVLLSVMPPVLPKVPASVLPPVLRGSCRGCHECGGRCIVERRRSRDVTVLTPGDGPPGAATSAMTKIEPKCRDADVGDRDAVCKAPWCCDTKGTPTPKGVAGSTTSERGPRHAFHGMRCGWRGAP